MTSHPKLWKIDKEMQQWCALLEAEMVTWPQVKTKPMFGMIGFYRGRNIFAAVPRSRAAGSERAILIKLAGVGRSTSTRKTSAWSRFELESEQDLTPALTHLQQAYERARRGKR